MIVDSHCHVYGYSLEELWRFNEIAIVGVGEDYESSLKNIELSRAFPNIIPFVGIHPWNIPETGEDEVRSILELARRSMGLGEVGLDKRFGRQYFENQLKVFEELCEVASELDLPLNVHALDSWEEALRIISRHDVGRAVFHWYNGPVSLLRDIRSHGYYISINPTVSVQPRHMAILEKAELDMILTESDGPYNYRGMRLDPPAVKSLLEIIARTKGVEEEDAEKTVERNFSRFVGRV